MLDDDRVLRCGITPERARYLLGTPFTEIFTTLAPMEEGKDDDDLNLEVFAMGMYERLNH
jgi:hypothetical protein